MLNRGNNAAQFYSSPDGQTMQARFNNPQSPDVLVLAVQNLRAKFTGRKRNARSAAGAARAAVGFAASR